MKPWLSWIGIMALSVVQTAQAEKLDLRQCIAQALAQNPSLMASASRIEQAQAAIDRSKSSYLPKISTSITASRSNDPLNVFGMKLMQQNATFNDLGLAEYTGNGQVAPQKLNSPGDYSNINTRIQAEMPLYTGGQIDAYVRQAQGFLAAAQAGDVAARQHLMFMVFQAYEGVNTAGAFVEVAEQGVKAAQSFVKTAENLTNQGVMVKSELLTAKVHLANVEVQLAQAQNQQAVALEQLKVLMGMALDAPLTLAQGRSIADIAVDVTSAKQRALANNPQLRALRMQTESSGAAVDAAKSAYLPTVGVMARQDWNDTSVALNHSSYTIAGVMNWTITDFGATRASVDMARSSQAELSAQLRQQEQELSFKVSEAYKKMTEAKQRANSLAINVEQADEAQRLVRQRHEGGVATITEVLVSETQLLKAKADLISARHDVSTQGALVRLLMGELEETLF
jgi:outer membrane protein TolC